MPSEFSSEQAPVTRVPKRIVAEISHQCLGLYKIDHDPDLVSRQFEKLISVNLRRGYVLESWQLVATPFCNVGGATNRLVETIVAVFREQPTEAHP